MTAKGWPRVQIARDLAVSPEKVSTLLRRATIRLRRELEAAQGAS